MNVYIGLRNHPRIKLHILFDSWMFLDCLIDTGFSGGISLPQKYKTFLKDAPIMYQKYELADGSKRLYSIYKLKTKFDNTIKIVNLSFTESDESFIGTEFLTGFKLILDLKKLLISLD